MVGEDICQPVERLTARKSLSEMGHQHQVYQASWLFLLHVLPICAALVVERPPYMNKVSLTMAVCCDHLRHISVGLSALATSSNGDDLISLLGAVLMGPASAPMGLLLT